MVMNSTTKQLPSSSTSPLRGDYSLCSKDYIVDQNTELYSRDEHQRWSTLFARQKAAAEKHASARFIDSLNRLELVAPLDIGIPCLHDFNPTLIEVTGWQLVAVPGLIPDQIFFEHLAKRQFPVTTWIRQAHEMDYIVEPDVFHDFFGHVPHLIDLSIANFLQSYGQQACNADEKELKEIARLYWYTVEYGLVAEENEIKAFGAGLLTSSSELEHSVQCLPKHSRFDVNIVRQSNFTIDRFQSRYFVLEGFQDLLGL
jgi:phenylalanine-4-hydroxylase